MIAKLLQYKVTFHQYCRFPHERRYQVSTVTLGRRDLKIIHDQFETNRLHRTRSCCCKGLEIVFLVIWIMLGEQSYFVFCCSRSYFGDTRWKMRKGSTPTFHSQRRQNPTKKSSRDLLLSTSRMRSRIDGDKSQNYKRFQSSKSLSVSI